MELSLIADRSVSRSWRASVLLSGLLCALPLPSQLGSPLVAEDLIQVGRGSYTTVLPPGRSAPPREVYKTAGVIGPLPTNRWWSSVLWMQFSERQYPHPLAVRAVASGLQIYYPGTSLTANDTAIVGTMPDGGRRDLLLEHGGCDSFADARLDGYSDWFVKLLFERGERRLRVSYGHGSPFVFASFENGTPRLRFEKPPTVWSIDASGAIAGISVEGAHYGIFGPPGFRWEGMKSDTWNGRCEGDCSLSIAVLPARDAATLKLFSRYAYNQVTDTRVRWKYDVAASAVATSFAWTTQPVESPVSRGDGTLFCLYPHQWKNTKQRLLDYSYGSVRGPLKLAEGATLTTEIPYTGVLPVLPHRAERDAEVRAAVLAEADRAVKRPGDSYRTGKQLGKLATLAAIAGQCGMPKAEEHFSGELTGLLQSWLQAGDPGEPQECFYYDSLWGTLIGYPASHGSDVELNDHQLHYGYFLMAAAAAARHDPKWAAEENWGGMVNLLIRDIACPSRDDRRFPFLRCFDPYAGHSWASGHAKFADGNNSESSSESIHAWCGLVLWGAATNDQELVDLGVFLYATEVEAAKCYWFDIDKEFHHPGFKPQAVGQVWGGKGAYGTWFSKDPAAIYGINWLPFHGGSLYLGSSPAYIGKVNRALPNNGQPQKWGDLVAMYAALRNPAEARLQLDGWRATGEFEEGNSLAQATYWIANLEALGAVTSHVRANHPFYAVFDRAERRTYVVYHFNARPAIVEFSDGTKVVSTGKGFTLQESARNKK